MTEPTTANTDTGDRDAGLPSTFVAWVDATRLAWQAWPFGLVARTGVSLATSLVGGVGLALSLGRVIDAVAQGRPVLVPATVLVVLVILDRWLSVAWAHVQHVMILKVQQLVRQKVMSLADNPVGVDHLESPLYLDRVDQVARSPERISVLFDWLASTAGSALGLLAALAALAALHPGLVLPVLLTGALGTVHARSRQQSLELMDRATVDQRLGDRLVGLGTRAASAFDVRMLALGPWLSSTHRASRDRVRRSILLGEQRVIFATALAAVLQAATLTGAIAFLVWLAGRGSITAGQVAIGVVLLRSGTNEASQLGGGAADLARNSFVVRRYSWLARHQGLLTRAAEPRDVPEVLTDGIEFCGVRFEYPGTSVTVLEDINLRLPAGSTVAFVGENGAGKTTLVKLLCRFYDPTSGSITVDGIDIRDLDPDAWRSRMTGAFQDFSRFLFTAGQSVGVGQPDRIDDDAAVAGAARRGNSAAFLEALPAGYSSQLGRELGGEDLSEGQWQRVAISRSAMRTDPLVVLLDEPTAALDPQAEHDLFERHAEAAADARDRGAVTVVVSHRFSTVRMADVIVVVDGGKIVETGTHAQLTARDGLYAELYGMQAGWFPHEV